MLKWRPVGQTSHAIPINFRRPGRRGMGSLLAAVVLFFIICFGVGISRHIMSTQVRNNAQSTSVGSLAQEVCRSALEEAGANLEAQMNDPSQTVFKNVRAETGIIPATRMDMDVPRTIERLKGPGNELLSGFAIEGGKVNVELVNVRRFSSTAYENVGTFRMLVSVKHGPTGVRREIRVERSYKLALLTVPRPYDQFTVSIRYPLPLYGETANLYILDALRIMEPLAAGDRERLVERITTVLEYVNAQIQRGNDALGRQDLRAEAQANQLQIPDPGEKYNIEEFVNPLQSAVLLVPPPFAEDVTAPWHYFPNDRDGLILATKVPRIILGGDKTPAPIAFEIAGQPGSVMEVVPRGADRARTLAFLNLKPRLDIIARRIRDLQPKHEQQYDQIWKLMQELVDLCAKDPASVDEYRARLARSDQIKVALRRLVPSEATTMNDLSQACALLLAEVRKYTDFFIESVEDRVEWLHNFLTHFNIEEWDKRATYRFEGATAAKDFIAFLDLYKKQNRAVNGVAVVKNPGETLKLENRVIHGKLVVVATGDVTLINVRYREPKVDLLTVQSLGTLTVRGEVHAALVAKGDFRPAQDTRIHGMLMLEQVLNPDLLTGSLENVERGTDNVHGRYYSGITGDARLQYLYAAWSPWADWTTVLRQ